MSKSYREQLPLLCDELSEEEYSPRYQRRCQPMTYRGRARNSLKGAAAIFTLWPDHWATFLTYWWIALGMLALTTLVIYNALFAYAVVPQENLRLMKPLITTSTDHKQKSHMPEVYMHLFSNYKDEIDMHQYLPYIEIISKKYPDFKYHLVIIMNDTTIETSNMSADENNEIALNSLWSKDKPIFKYPNHNDINVEYVTLSEYMNSSPLKKYWRALSNQLLKFLIRAVGIWNKGGIAFDPVILTPRSPHAAYIEKLQNIFHDYNQLNKQPPRELKTKKDNTKKIKKYKQRVNNIRDIIEALENEDNSATYSEQILTEAENKENAHVTRNVRKLFSVTESLEPLDISEKSAKNYPKAATGEKKEDSIELDQNHKALLDHSIAPENTTKMNLLPLFLEYLFHNKAPMKASMVAHDTTSNDFTTTESVVRIEEKSYTNIASNISNDRHNQLSDKYKPMIVSTKFIPNKTDAGNIVENSSKSYDGNQLIIDLRGNIIATETPCHAFLGTVFSNSVHHDEDETVTDFIIAELSIFCKGLLSTCMGIDLILL